MESGPLERLAVGLPRKGHVSRNRVVGEDVRTVGGIRSVEPER